MASVLHKKKEGDKPKEIQSIVDGYWITLQDWTDCSQKCGGGLSYQHLMCIPPKNGGKPCEGRSLRTKPCNVNPCPSAKTLIEKTKKGLSIDSEVRKPIMKVGRFSSRPQKYSKCLMKENDAFLTEFDYKGEVLKKTPVRVLMNNQTLSIFQDDDYADLLLAYNLKNTMFSLPKNFCCFSLQDNEKRSGLCGYPENCGVDIQKNQWANKWKDDYYDFKVVCETGRVESLLTPNDLNALEDKNNENNDMEIDLPRIKKQQLKDEMNIQETQLFRKSFSQTQEVGFKAIERELNIEKMVKKEEEQKESEELAELEAKVKKEEKKASCVHKSIEEKDFDSFFEDKMEALDEMERLKVKINNKVLDSRNKIKKLLGDMRRKADRKKEELQDKIAAVRSKMAQEILLANREGDIKNCLRGKKDLDFRTNYCSKNFVDDYETNSVCNSNDFCYTCCENEFGANMKIKRNRCYKSCDDKEKPKEKKNKEEAEQKNDSGYSWLWATQQQTK